MTGFTSSRRAFLGGAGALLTLPFLPSLLGRGARADDTPPVRLIWFFIPNGVVPGDWSPVDAGGRWAPADTPGSALTPLADIAGEITAIQGLQNLACIAAVKGAHSQATGGALTCVAPHSPEVWIGTSADQVAAARTRSSTVLPSLQVGAELIRFPSCEQQYPCDYLQAISWEAADRALPPIDDPVVLLRQLTAGADPLATAEEIARRAARRSSVLDYLLDDAGRARAKAGVEDRRHLDQYLDGVRELERRVEQFGEAGACAALDAWDPADDDERADLVSDLVVHALQCDRTRVVSYMLGKGQSKRDLAFLGIAGDHHAASHHLDEPGAMKIVSDIVRWEVDVFGRLVRKLRDTPEGSGSLLDACAVQLLSDLGDGNLHNHDQLPVLLAGRAGGAFTPGGLLVAEGEPLASLHLSMLQALDPSITSFAESRQGLDGVWR